MRTGAAIAAVALVFACGNVGAAPHPFHDDGGAVDWQLNFSAAMQLARRTGKPILLEASRPT